MPVRYDIASMVPQISGGGAIDPLNYMAQMRQQEMAEAQMNQMNLRGYYQDLAAQRAAEASQRAAETSQRQTRESELKTQAEQEKLLASKINRVFSAIAPTDQESFLKATHKFYKDDAEFADWLRSQSWDEDLRNRLILTGEQQVQAKQKAEEPVMIDKKPFLRKGTELTPLMVRTAPETAARAAPTEGMPGPRGAAVGTQLTRKFEGFIPTAKFDVDAERVGYGSDTITTPEGKVVPVAKGTTTTEKDAERDLKRRIETEFIPKAAAQVGQENWDRLPENVAGALTSVTYNYGSLPRSIAAAVKTGNVDAIANAVESLADDNKGINRGRRMSEAATIRGSEMPGTAAVPSFAAAPPPAALGMSPQIAPPINMLAGNMPIQNAMAAPQAAPMQPTTMTPEEFAKIPLKQKNTEFFKGLLTSYEDQSKAGLLPTKEEGMIPRAKKIAMANIPSAVARAIDPAAQELRDITINKIDQYISMLRETGGMTGGEGNTIAELEAKKKMLGASDLTMEAARRIVADLDKNFGTGTIKAEGGATTKGVTVNVPGMGAVSFPSQEAADAFRREAGL
jgi:GH24 family phage-related lysozyme (muramidase)